MLNYFYLSPLLWSLFCWFLARACVATTRRADHVFQCVNGLTHSSTVMSLVCCWPLASARGRSSSTNCLCFVVSPCQNGVREHNRVHAGDCDFCSGYYWWSWRSPSIEILFIIVLNVRVFHMTHNPRHKHPQLLSFYSMLWTVGTVLGMF